MLDKLFCTVKYKNSLIKVNMDALNKYERLKDNCLFSTIDRNAVSDKALKVFVMNVSSFRKHVNDIVFDHRCFNLQELR